MSIFVRCLDRATAFMIGDNPLERWIVGKDTHDRRYGVDAFLCKNKIDIDDLIRNYIPFNDQETVSAFSEKTARLFFNEAKEAVCRRLDRRALTGFGLGGVAFFAGLGIAEHSPMAGLVVHIGGLVTMLSAIPASIRRSHVKIGDYEGGPWEPGHKLIIEKAQRAIDASIKRGRLPDRMVNNLYLPTLNR